MKRKVQIILASASPRRHDLLCAAMIPHEIVVSDTDEAPQGMPTDGELYAEWYAREASRVKARAVRDMLSERDNSCSRVIVVAADTVVSPDGHGVLGKPRDAEDARRMLSMLSGAEHHVIGGITVVELGTGKEVSETVLTSVEMKSLTESEIDAYIGTGEPFGKAGAYAIQGAASVFVRHIDGDYANVVGISVSRLAEILRREFSVNVTEELSS